MRRLLLVIAFFLFFIPAIFGHSQTVANSGITKVVNLASTPAIITASPATGTISACQGTASASPNVQQFTVSGSNLTADITATAPTGFEVSLAAGSGYGNSVTLNQSSGNISNVTIYVRSAATDGAGNITGNVVLNSTGAADQNVLVSGTVNPLPTVNNVPNQTINSGSLTTAVNFTGTGNIIKWTNNTPAIGLAASGTGNIPAFTAINTGGSPVTATITATPVSEGFAYITNEGDGNISVISVATNTVIATITPPHDPFAVCISPDGSRAYIGCGGGLNTVTVINTITNQIINTITVNTNGENTGITITPDGSMLYVNDYQLNTVSAINISTGAVVAVIPVGQFPYGIAISPDGSKVFVAFTYGNYISVINTSTNTITANITVGTAPPDLVISPDGSKVYVPVSNSNHIAVIDVASNMISDVIPTGAPPGVIALSPDGSRAYVSAEPNNVLVINITTKAIIATIPIASAANGISVSPDGQFVYVTDSGTKNVSVINASTNTVITTVNVNTTPVSLGSFVTPGTGCTGTPTTFTFTVNPSSLPTISASPVTGNITGCEGTASSTVQQFTVSGSGLTANITATAPLNFEVSLNATTGYSGSLTLTQINGAVSNTIVYVRASATATAGNITDNVDLTSAGAANKTVIVSYLINAVPVADPVSSQILTNGAATLPVNFGGTATTFNWVNDNPGIGLATNGSGDIPSFTAVNNTANPVTATITVTPLNNTSCNGTPIIFIITVNPTAVPTTLMATAHLTPLATIYGTPSSAESFTVSGTNISGGISVTPPSGFEVSSNGAPFNATITINGNGNFSSALVYIRLAAVTPAGSYSGNIVLSTANTTIINVFMPVSTVSPAPLTITADNIIKPFGAVNPPLTVTYGGFVNKDGPAQLNSQPVVATIALTQSPIGQYSITVSNAASPNYTFTYIPGTLTIEPAISALSIPNTFTPNGDGINDTWEIKYLNYYPKSTVNIFSRWGQKVFSSTGYPTAWDGTYRGAVVPSGTYYYIIDPKNGQAVFSGWLAIIR